MSPNISAARGALKLSFFVSSLTVASLGARLATADISPDGEARAFGLSAGRLVQGDLSDQALHTLFDPDRSALFARHDPGVKSPLAVDILKGYEQGAPLSPRGDLTPQQAQWVNQAVPVSGADNPEAKPFIFHGAAGDRATALTCLTQAVYYEAGFEPIQGAQAVAQVVLNRMRHPIFPKSVCGVVYQGAELKTGCQFSFTCDGSLAKTPAKGAWDRAKAVADKALSGFVQKDVGEATHYHTQWIRPWWAPTVSKVAQVGTQIFYRWPGQLGMPSAFVGRYAGNERIGKGALSAPTLPDAPQTIARMANGRVHAVFDASGAAPVEVAKATAAAPAAPKADAPEPAPTTSASASSAVHAD